MREPALDADSLGALAAGPRMGLGWFDESRNGRAVVGHGGDTLAFHSHAQLWPDDDTGIYMSFNSTGTDAAALLLREELLDGFADRYFPSGETAPGTVDATTRAAHARALAGTYESTRGFHTTFLTIAWALQPIEAAVVDGDRVRFSAGVGLAPTVYEEVEPWLYREVDGHRVLAVHTDDDDRVQLISHDSAMSLMPLSTARAVALPILTGGIVLLLVTVLAWPVGALVRWIRSRRRSPDSAATDSVVPGSAATDSDLLNGGPTRLPRTLTRVAALSAVLGLLTWVYVFVAVLSMEPLPDAVIRTAQALTALGMLGLLGAVWRLTAEVRTHSGWFRLTTSAAVLLGFAAFSFGAYEFLLVSPDISY
ncbi:MAG: hypothetical protein ACK4M5_15950, partial [Dietzia cercidiphylli]